MPRRADPDHLPVRAASPTPPASAGQLDPALPALPALPQPHTLTLEASTSTSTGPRSAAPLPPWRRQLAELREQLAARDWMPTRRLHGNDDLVGQGWMTTFGGPGPTALAQETLIREAGRVVDLQVQRRVRQALAGQPRTAALRRERDRLRRGVDQISNRNQVLRALVRQRLLDAQFEGRPWAELSSRERLRLSRLELDDLGLGPEIRDGLARLRSVSERREELEWEIAAAEIRDTRAQRRALLEVLATQRPMGAMVNGQAWRFVDRAPSGLASDPEVPALLEQGAQFWPRSWIDASNRVGELHAQRAWRGYTVHYANGPSTIAVSPKGNSRIPEDSAYLPVAIHELAHRMERAVDGLTGFEWTFYRRRTTPRGGHPGRDQAETEQLVRLLPGSAYWPEEVARKDRFADPYIGKDCSGGSGGHPDASYEVFPTGVEGLWTGNYPIDADHRRFVLGLLALLPGRPRR